MPLRRLAASAGNKAFKMAVLSLEDISPLSLLYKLGHLTPASADHSIPSTISRPNPGPITPNKVLNDRVSVVRHDITKLALDAITNAANRSLLGGGGIDGAIHSAAGRGLLNECRTLGGCETGKAKITAAYDLPCRNVIHAVGPVYDDDDPEESERLLTSCYNEVLNLAVDNNCKTLALCGISTGIYGYPPQKAAPVAMSTVRKFLESDKGQELEAVVFVTWIKPDVDSHMEWLPVFFPPVEETVKNGPTKEENADTQKSEALNEKSSAEVETATDLATESAQAAEAEKMASQLPDVPKSDPEPTLKSAEGEPPEKKQKQGE